MVLVPFISQTPGAFGTVWRNELLIGNPLDRDVFVVQGGPCQLGAGCYEAEHIEPRSVERIADDRALDNPSTVFFVEKGFARRLSWLLRTRDTSSDETTNEVIGSAELVLLQGSPRTLEPLSFRQRPSVGQLLGLSSKFPAATTRNRVKIRIEPLSPTSLRFWAALFIVDNAED